MSHFEKAARESAVKAVDVSVDRVVDATASTIGSRVADDLEGTEIDAAIADGIDEAINEISEEDYSLMVDAVSLEVRQDIRDMAEKVATRLFSQYVAKVRADVSTPVA